MVRKRPTVILVMAILSITFGSLWLLLWLCVGAMPFILYHLPVPQPGGGTGYPYRELLDLLQREIPGYAAVEVGNAVLGLVLSVLLILSGIGLLRMQNWARWTSVIFGGVTVVKEIAHSIFSWIYVNPVTERWAQELVRKLPPGTPDFSGNRILNTILEIGAVIASIAFAGVLLVVMFLPNVRAAFAGRRSGPVKAAEGYSDPEPDDEGR
jgi:hypothetical protein